MKLYHFTAAHLLPEILREGLTKGWVPWSDSGQSMHFREGQWLTTSRSWEQSWCNPQFSSLPYRRNEVRLTVEVLRLYRGRVKRWMNYCKGNKLKQQLNAYGNPECWRVFNGSIPPEWITEVDLNPRVENTTERQ